MTTKRIVVRGRVQGVSYRAWTIWEARRLGLAGWVRNRRDGSVEILASGSEDKVAALAERCWQGPSMARVESIDVMDADDVAPQGFEERSTV